MSCLQQDMKQVRKDAVKFTEQLNPSKTDTNESATTLLTYQNGSQYLYKYSGTGDQCLVVEIFADKGSQLDLVASSALLSRQHYDAAYSPTDDDLLRYQSIRGQAILATGKVPTIRPAMLVNWH